MRVCDRHPKELARDTILVEADYQRFDLCAECKTEILLFLTDEKARFSLRKDSPKSD